MKRWVNQLHNDTYGLRVIERYGFESMISRCQVVEIVGLAGNEDGCGRDRGWSFMVIAVSRFLSDKMI